MGHEWRRRPYNNVPHLDDFMCKNCDIPARGVNGKLPDPNSLIRMRDGRKFTCNEYANERIVWQVMNS